MSEPELTIEAFEIFAARRCIGNASRIIRESGANLTEQERSYADQLVGLLRSARVIIELAEAEEKTLAGLVEARQKRESEEAECSS